MSSADTRFSVIIGVCQRDPDRWREFDAIYRTILFYGSTRTMLARRTPLPAGADLAAGIGTLPLAPLRNLQEVAVRGFDAGQPVDAIDLRLNRDPAKQAQQIDEPLLQLLVKLRPHFDVTRAVRFAHQGE
jgi:hypothetical protein